MVKSKTACCAPGCQNKNDSSFLSFFRLPIECGRRAKWLEILGLASNHIFRTTEPKICSIHFKPDQFTSRNKVWLKRTALPFQIPENELQLSQTLKKPKTILPKPIPVPGIQIPKIGKSSPPRKYVKGTNVHGPSNSNIEVQETRSPVQSLGLPQQWIVIGTGEEGTSQPFSLNPLPAGVDQPKQGEKESESCENQMILDPFSKKLCIMCNANVIEKENSGIPPSLVTGRGRIIKTLMKILKLSSYEEFDDDNYLFCVICFQQVSTLVIAYDELHSRREYFERLKKDILEALAISFCRRKASEEEDESAKRFYESVSILKRMTDRVSRQNENNLVGSKVNQVFEECDEEFLQYNGPENDHGKHEYQDSIELVTIDDSDDENFGSSDNHEHDPTGNQRIDAFTQLPVSNFGEVEICFKGKRGATRAKRKWEVLSNCAETKSGLEKLLPLYLRRVTCPICKRKFPPVQLSAHLTRHSNLSNKTLTGIQEKLVSMSTETVKGNLRRRMINQKWRSLAKVKSSTFIRNGVDSENSDSYIPVQCRRVSCPTCNKEVSLAYLSTHLNTHTGERPYKCPECPKSFAGKSNLVSHRQVHIEKIPFRFNTYFCDFCESGRKFQFRSNYVRHILKAHSENLGSNDILYFYNCDAPGCVESYRDKEQLVEHLRTHNNEGIIYGCPSPGCERVFTDSTNCERHCTELHSEPMRYGCKYCPEIFENDEVWMTHELTHGLDMSTEQRIHLCEECGKGFKTKLQLWIHKQNRRVHLPKSDRKNFIETESVETEKEKPKKFSTGKKRRKNPGIAKSANSSCQFCYKKITNRLAMTNHLLDVHTYEKRLNCYICKDEFKKLTSLQAHIRRHLGLPRKTSKEKCIYCGEELPHAISLREHCIKNHADQYLSLKPFYCRLCWFRFVTEEEVTAHQLKLHEQWKCTYCGKQLLNRMRFEDHTRIHTGETPFVCHICKKGFRMKVNLKEHVMRHNGEKPYNCHLCSTKIGFFRKRLFKNHMETVHSMNGDEFRFAVTEPFEESEVQQFEVEVLQILDGGENVEALV